METCSQSLTFELGNESLSVVNKKYKDHTNNG